jgi:undecaprenyl pyrophosphate synthase
MFFLDKQWPELTKGDLINVLKDYAKNRQRRFGK